MLPVETRGARSTGLVDDHALAPGVWELEATATDQAGNSTVSDRTISQDPAIINLPLRGQSRIEASVAGVPGDAASAASEVSVGHGARCVVAGRVLDRDGQPEVAAFVSVQVQTRVPGAQWTQLGGFETDGRGRFSIQLPAGPGRRIRISYSGNHRNFPSTATVTMRVPARSTVRSTPARLRVGSVARFAGQLEGGWIPSGGKLVLVQALIPHRGWQTFAAARAHADGRWAARYRFRAAVGRVRYRIRAVVPAEAAYPFSAFTSKPIGVVVIG